MDDETKASLYEEEIDYDTINNIIKSIPWKVISINVDKWAATISFTTPKQNNLKF